MIKISYPSGEVLNTYGLAYKPGVSLREGDQFSVQHSCKRSQNGDLYLYNNNAFGRSNLPTVQMFEEPGPGESNLKKVWEYQCTVESDDPVLKQARFFFGGCVTELPDRSMFIFMGKPYPKLSIVSHDKKILWSAIQEKYNTDTKKWEIFTKTYRASLVSRKELEQLIWASQQKS